VRLGVLGWPVGHSRSPAMHNAALGELGLADWRYQLLPVPPGLLSETVGALAGSGFVGANVTIPHKQAAFRLADEASRATREIGAANTLTFSPAGGIAAENTDAPGVVAALERPVRGLRVLVLGAGGSGRAAVWAMRDEGAAEVMVWNRTPERARALAAEMGVSWVPAPVPADVLVNCTSIGLERSASQAGALNQIGLSFDQIGEYSDVVDLVYSPGSTPLLGAARALGIHAVDGLDVLAAQGALSLRIWTGRSVPIDLMRRAARQGYASA
jgi:shikimate dehydrogenase